jgi:transposase
MTTLADRLLPDQLWQRIQPLLPPPPSRARGGAPRTVPDRACMAAILFMARTSTPWALLPVGEFGCGSVTTCWRRVAEWAHAGMFERLHEVLLDELGEAGALDWSRLSADSFSLRAVRGDQLGANPVDRAKPGSKLHLAVDGGGLPLSLLVTGANTNDSLVFAALLDDLPPVRTPAGRRRCRPEKVHADKAYDHRRCRRYLSRRGSRSASPAVGSSPRSGWAAIAGRRNARSRGWLGAGGCASATTAGPSGSRVRHAGLRPAVLQPAAVPRQRRVKVAVPDWMGRTVGKGSDEDELGRARLGDEGDREWEHTRRPGAATLGLSDRPGASSTGCAAFAAALDVAALFRLGAAVGHRTPAPARAAGVVKKQPAASRAAVQDRQVRLAGEQLGGGVGQTVHRRVRVAGRPCPGQGLAVRDKLRGCQPGARGGLYHCARLEGRVIAGELSAKDGIQRLAQPQRRLQGATARGGGLVGHADPPGEDHQVLGSGEDIGLHRPAGLAVDGVDQVEGGVATVQAHVGGGGGPHHGCFLHWHV